VAKAKKHLGSADDIEAAFYDAINRGDVDALMALWADDDEIVCIHPGSLRLIGHAAIRASWAEILKAGGIPIHPAQMHATHNLMTAVHSLIEEIRLPAGERAEVHVHATNVYLKTPAGWRIVAHHASVAPGKAGKDARGTNTLH
jgi:ketosteroid isomerase-like protein